MKKLIADLADGKLPWQSYTVKHGIESFEVLVPLKNSALFETQMKKPMPTKAAIIRTLHECGGVLK